MKNILVLAAGKQESFFTTFNGEISYGMYPIRGKPSILHIVDMIKCEDLPNTIFVVNQNNLSLIKLLQNHHKTEKSKIVTINTDLSKNKILNTLELGLSNSNHELKTKIILGDTLILDEESNEFDTIFTSKNFQDSKRWCLIEKNDNNLITDYFDKIENLNTNEKEVLVGVYNIQDTHLLKESVKKAISENKFEISDVLRNYQQRRDLFAVNVEKWHDLSSPYAIAKAGSSLFNVRHFNSINVYENGLLVKSSENKQKLKQEEKWYKSLPKNLQTIAPRVIDSTEDDRQFHLSIEMYGYQTLSEIFVYGEKSTEDWRSIIERLIDVYGLFNKFTSSVSSEYLISIYKTKTQERLKMLECDLFFNNLLNKNTITINKKDYKNFNIFKEQIFLTIEKLTKNYFKKEFSIVHGDLCFSNILFDSMNYCFKFIDPRGDVLYGDSRYDIAKLRHSVVGLYDFIVLEMFELSQASDNEFDFNIFISKNKIKIGQYFDNIIEKNYNIFEIKFIEALLFLTMIPLHKDFKKKQLAFYLIAVKKFNELFYE